MPYETIISTTESLIKRLDPNVSDKAPEMEITKKTGDDVQNSEYSALEAKLNELSILICRFLPR